MVILTYKGPGKNKPNSRRCRATLPHPSALRPRPWAKGSCTNKANPGYAGRDEGRRGGGRGTNAPNKPNFRRSKKRGKGLPGKELW